MLWLIPLSVFFSSSEVVLWHSYRAGEEQALQKIVQQIEIDTPITIRTLAIPFGAYDQKLRQAIGAGLGPDLFIAGHDTLGDWLARKALDPVEIENEGLYLSETLGPLKKTDGGYWGLPLAFKTLVLFYRRDWLPEPPATTDDLIRLGKHVAQQGQWGLGYDLGSFYYHSPWFFGAGARLDFGDPHFFSSAPSIAAATFFQELTQQHRITPSDLNGALVTELFNRGQLAMVVNGPWFLSEINDTIPFAVSELPMMSSQQRPASPFSTIEAVFITQGRSRPEVLKVAHALVSDSAANTRATIARQPVANRTVYDQLSDPTLTTFKRQLAHSTPMPTVPEMQLFWEPAAQALREISRGSRSPEEALVHAERRFTLLRQGLPAPTSSTPYVIFGCLAGCLFVAFGARRFFSHRQQIWRAKTVYLFVLPTTIGMALLVGIPFIWAIGLGFYAHGPGEERFVGLQNFQHILGSLGAMTPNFYWTLGVTILWTVFNVALHALLGTLLALLLAPQWLWGRAWFRVLLLLPWAVPSYITALIFKGLFNKQLGAINAVLQKLSLAPVGWFDHFWSAFFANLCTNVWLGFPFMMVNVTAGLQAIPQNLYDAAALDGANAWTRFRRITLPLLGPALMPSIVLGTLWTFNMFNIVYLVSEGQPEGSTDILVTEAYRWAFARNGNYGYAAAYSLVIFAILLVYHRVTQKWLGRYLEAHS